MAVTSNFRRVALISLGFCAAFGASQALAAGIEVKAPWTRATVRGAMVGAGFLTVENKGTEADRLTGATTDAAAKVEIHETRMDNGVMKMREASDGVEIKPGASLTLKPGSYHLMLLGLKAPLLPGGAIHVTLNFAKAGAIAVIMPVEPAGASAPPAAAATDTTPAPSY